MALSRALWMNICINMLGLRSASGPEDLGGASYAMDDGGDWRSVPEDWEEKLEGTLRGIAAFGNAEGRYLLLVKGVTGTGESYAGTFKKCSSRPSSVVASTLIGGQDTASLKAWVIEHVA